MAVVAGEYSLILPEPDEQIIAIADIVSHPDYNNVTKQFNVALLEVTQLYAHFHIKFLNKVTILSRFIALDEAISSLFPICWTYTG